MTAKKTNDLRLAAVIADKIEDGTLFHSGIFTRAEIAGKVRNLIAAANQQQADALDTERLDWLIEQGCSHGVVYELDKSFWMVWLDGHDAHKDKHQIGRHHTAREAIDAAIAAAEAAHKQHAQPQADARDAERWSEIGKSIERACGELPEDFKINIYLENGAGTASLLYPSGEECENFPHDDGFAGVVNAAIDAAIAATNENK